MDCLADYISNSPSLLALIPQCFNTNAQTEFVESAAAFLRSQQINHNPDELFSHFASFISSSLASSGLKASVSYPSITTAFTQFRENRDGKRAFKKKLVSDLNLGLTPEQHDAILASVPVYYINRLSVIYPLLNTCIYETDIIGDQWQYQLEHGKLADVRQSRKPLAKLDFNKLQHNVNVTSNAIFRDSQTNEIVGLVLRNFVGRKDVQQWASTVIDDSLRMKKSVRLEDSGTIALEGYSAGSRNMPMFGWVKNLKTKVDAKTFLDQRYRASSLFALLWNIYVKVLPSEIGDDIKQFLHDNPMYRMDAGSEGKSEMRFSIQIGQHEIDFFGRELAPPSGVLAQNYSRHIHVEKSPHKYAISWNNRRTLSDDYGGNFYFADYGIRVASSADMLFVHKPADAHGTGLPWKNSNTDGVQYFTSGISIITSSRIVSSWRKYQDKLIDLETFEAEMEESDD
jgi:hypothetical protein